MLSLTELGKRLREAREAKELSLDELQQLTKIQKRYLQGIEEGNYSAIPGPFYVRAFIKQYAESVGLKPEILFEEYKDELPTTGLEEIPEQMSRVKTHQVSDRTTKLFDLFPKVLIAIFIIGALALVWYFGSLKGDDRGVSPVEDNNNTPIKLEERETPPEADEPEDNIEGETAGDEQQEGEGDDEESDGEEGDLEEEESTQNLTVVESKGDKSIYELKNTDQFILKVVSTGESWINIKNGKGYSFYSGMITSEKPDGETVDFTNENEAVIVVGRSTETDIYVNDEKLEYEISPKDAVKQDITIRFIRDNE